MVGDAVHKATANLGMGGNLCIDDVCRLVNGLVPLLKQNDTPTNQELAKVFDEYERAAKPRASFVYYASAFLYVIDLSPAPWLVTNVRGITRVPGC